MEGSRGSIILLPKSKLGYEYLFTRWVECVPIRKANARTILKEFKERVVLRFGTPEVFLSDNGTEFKNKAVEEYLAGIGVHHSTTPPYHPQANPVERVNRTLKTRLIAFVEETHAEWDQKLPELMFSLNNSVHASTGVSPATLNYGRQLLPPATARREQEREALEQREREAVENWAERLQETDGLRKRAAAQAAEEQQRQASYYNARRREVNYGVGDLVMRRYRVLSSAAQGIGEADAEVRRSVENYGDNRLEYGESHRREGRERRDSPRLSPQAIQRRRQRRIRRRSRDGEDTQPPREETSVPVMNDPPEVGGAPPSDARQTEKRPRGRPRKTVRVVKRAISRKAHATTGTTVETKKTRGRPKGSAKRVEPKVNRNLSPRTTRA